MANIVSGVKYKALADAANGIWNKISFWKKAVDVELEDGTNAEFRMNQLVQKTTGLDDEVTAFETNYPQWESAVVSSVNADFLEEYGLRVTYPYYQGLIRTGTTSSNEALVLSSRYAQAFEYLIHPSVQENNFTTNPTITIPNTLYYPIRFWLWVQFTSNGSTYNVDYPSWDYTKNSTDTHGNSAQKIEATGRATVGNANYTLSIYIRDEDKRVEIVFKNATNNPYFDSVKIGVQMNHTSAYNAYSDISTIQNRGLYDVYNQTALNAINSSIDEYGDMTWYPHGYLLPDKLTPTSTGDTSVWEWYKLIDLSSDGGYGNGFITIGFTGSMGDALTVIKYKDKQYVWEVGEGNTIASRVDVLNDNEEESADDTSNVSAIVTHLNSSSNYYPLLILINIPTGEEGDIVYVSHYSFSAVYSFVIEQSIESPPTDEELGE